MIHVYTRWVALGMVVVFTAASVAFALLRTL